MGEVLAMNEKERVRLVELAGVSRGEQSVAAASRRLGLSYRQTKRRTTFRLDREYMYRDDVVFISRKKYFPFGNELFVGLEFGHLR